MKQETKPYILVDISERKRLILKIDTEMKELKRIRKKHSKMLRKLERRLKRL